MDFPRSSDGEGQHTFQRASSDISPDQGQRAQANNPQVRPYYPLASPSRAVCLLGASSLTSSSGTPNTSPASDTSSTMHNKVPKSKPSLRLSTSSYLFKDLQIPYQAPHHDPPKVASLASPHPNYINHTPQSPSYPSSVDWS